MLYFTYKKKKNKGKKNQKKRKKKQLELSFYVKGIYVSAEDNFYVW